MIDTTDEKSLPTNRIEALCDGIFAIAMTLIILDLKTPENIPYSLVSHELPNVLINLLPEVEAYIISFIILGVFWLRHQIQFLYIKTADRTLMAISVIFLMLIGFIPFSVGFMMRYNEFHVPFLVYIINLLAISLVMFLQWQYASSRFRLLDKNLDPHIVKLFSELTFVPIIIFSVSLIVSFVSVRMAFYIIYIDPLIYVIYRRYQSKKHSLSKSS